MGKFANFDDLQDRINKKSCQDQIVILQINFKILYFPKKVPVNSNEIFVEKKHIYFFACVLERGSYFFFYLLSIFLEIILFFGGKIKKKLEISVRSSF